MASQACFELTSGKEMAILRARDAVEIAGGERGDRFIVAPERRFNGFFRALAQEAKPLPLCQAVRNVVAGLVQGGFHLIGDASRDPDRRFTGRNTEPSGRRCRVELIDALLRLRKQNEIIVESAEDNTAGRPERRRPACRRIVWRQTKAHCRSAVASFNSLQLLRSMASPKLSRFLYVALRCSAI